MDWYARKNNRSLYEEVDIAIDTYLDGLSMQGLLSDEDDSLEMGPPPERYELFFPDMMALIASETIEQLQESPLKDYLCKNPSMFKELKDVANESLRQPIIQVIGQNIIPLV